MDIATEVFHVFVRIIPAHIINIGVLIGIGILPVVSLLLLELVTDDTYILIVSVKVRTTEGIG